MQLKKVGITAPATEQLARLWGGAMRIPLSWTQSPFRWPILLASSSTTVCRKQFRTTSDKGYSAALDDYYIGYKYHVVLTLDGAYHSMDPAKASVHDPQYLQEIKHSGLRDCLLLADKGYLSAQGQLELFASKGIDLQTPMRRNQHGFSPWSKVFKTARRRIEPSFSQRCDQMTGKRNYAKTFIGLRARLIAKVTAVSLLQYINQQNDRPITNIKHALAA